MAMLLIILITLLVHALDARVMARDFKTMQLRQQKSWLYLDRMELGPGEVVVSFWGRLHTETLPAYSKYRLTLQLIPD